MTWRYCDVKRLQIYKSWRAMTRECCVECIGAVSEVGEEERMRCSVVK